ncbi:hypothetical protein M8818_003451 [Zalaria obscura]|uniref:Uncharacterized protein n=1 Tax=Zalaria obscura TaxID=2024903 RepID=A0ACC3SG85_9PEZI
MSAHPTRPGSSTSTNPSRLSTLPTSASKTRQLNHLHAQLAQLTAHMSDLENLLRMTAVQAEMMRGLGGYAGGMFMAASKVLGEETVGNSDGEGEEKARPSLPANSTSYAGFDVIFTEQMKPGMREVGVDRETNNKIRPAESFIM